jgi:Tol biopolymer transport system component
VLIAGAAWLLAAPSVAGAQGLVVFQSDRGRASGLYTFDSGTGKTTALTSGATPSAAPSWFPDGDRIVYACAPDGNWDICALTLATGQVDQLTETPIDEFDPRVTGDGNQIVLETYPTGRNADIAVMPADGGDPQPLTTTPAVDDQDPTTDPDPTSQRIAFASGGNIAVSDLGSSAEPRFVTHGSQGDTDPFFSSQNEIAFARSSRAGHELLAVEADTGAERPLTEGAPDDVEPAFTSDAAQIVFTRQSSSKAGFRLFVMDSSGQGQRPLSQNLTGRYDDTEPEPQPSSSVGFAAAPAFAFASASCNVINGGSSGTTLNGTKKADCIYGWGGKDRISGRAGNDRLEGGTGSDTLFGEDGNDRMFTSDGLKDTLDGGAGANEASIDTGLDSHMRTAVH